MRTPFRTIRSAITCTLLLLIPAVAHGQDLARDPVSPRIRISADSPLLRGATAEALEWDSSGMTIVRRLRRSPPDTFRVGAGAITSLDVAVGRQSNAGRGALTGGLLFGAAGLLLAVAVPSCDGGLGCVDLSASERAYVVLGSAALGAGIGALVGMASSRDRWAPWPGDGR